MYISALYRLFKGSKLKRLLLVITVGLFSFNSIADETCGDYLGSAKSGDIKKMWSSYKSGINDIGFVDSVEYSAKFSNASTDQNDKNSMQWMMQRAYNKCLRLSPSEHLSEVIKATM
ncbi:hypothetical protein CIT27_17515 [Photobacterium carnosum]|nr:hypothetical protein CIT27_17515 [Photobacterium carnosum]